MAQSRKSEPRTMEDLFLSFLQDIYYAERQLLKTMPKLVKAAESEELRDMLTRHREQTQGQVERLQRVFETIGRPARGATCEALNGIIEEATEMLEQFEPGGVRDAGLIANGQAIEHYEIARYGTMVAWAKALGNEEAADLLQQNLDEEKETDALLSDLANTVVNEQAEAE